MTRPQDTDRGSAHAGSDRNGAPRRVAVSGRPDRAGQGAYHGRRSAGSGASRASASGVSGRRRAGRDAHDGAQANGRQVNGRQAGNKQAGGQSANKLVDNNLANSHISFGQAQSARHDRRPLIAAAVVVVLLILIVTFAVSACSGAKASQGSAGNAGQTAQDAAAANDHAAGAGAGAAGAAGEPTQITVTFAGDCTLGTDSAFDYATSFNATYENVEDPAYFLRNVADIFGADDLTVVNMEGTLTTSDTRADKTFAFKGDADYARVFSTSSVEAASMANNHSRDYGQQSYDDTIEALDAQGIRSFGYDDVAMMDVKGKKVALIGAYELDEGEGIIPRVTQQVQQARADGADLLLVYVHWGVELDTVPNQTQIDIGHAAIDAGADLVVGSHPHVIQGYEVYQGRYIVYSLGNFCFGGNANPTDSDCMMFQQTFTLQPKTGEDGQTATDVQRNDDVDFIACSVSSADGYNNYQPTPATGDDKARIEQKIKDSTDQIAELVS